MKGTPKAIRDWLISSQQASPANPSASPESKPENQTKETSGPKLLNAFVSYDPDLRYWKTSLGSLLPPERLYMKEYFLLNESGKLEPYKLNYHPMSDEFLETYPRAGMIVDGKLFRRLKWERRINEIGSGYWRTPDAHEWKNRSYSTQIYLDDQVMNRPHKPQWPTPRSIYGEHPGMKDESHLTGAAQMWPTPKALTGGPNSKRKERGSGGPDLQEKVLWPTPSNSMMTVGDMEQARFAGSDPKRPSYNDANQKWATPSAWDSVGSHGGGQGRSLRTDVHGQGGQLSPDWVCWLMGWPIGADSLKPMPDLMWLDWEIDPADMEKPTIIPTPSQRDYKGMSHQGENDLDTLTSIRPSGIRFGMRTDVYAELKGNSIGPIPRVATGIKDRVNRLKALGNGMVPQCMATAWNILIGDFFLDS